MRFNKVLLIYKRSTYNVYFGRKNSPLRKSTKMVVQKEMGRFRAAHVAHYETLRRVANVLHKHGIDFTEVYRDENINMEKYPLIITVGGDGTFLKAARQITNQVILGVNSAPNHSVGMFCIADASNFSDILYSIINNKFQIKLFHRLRIRFEGVPKHVDALNDVLVCHANPAMLYRYYLKVGGRKEEQRSSGIWISTAAGCTGAIKSAGGKILGQYDRKIQYMPRELYSGNNTKYRLKGGVIASRQRIEITSLMPHGKVYVDGAHQHYRLLYGSSIILSLSPNPIKTIEI